MHTIKTIGLGIYWVSLPLIIAAAVMALGGCTIHIYERAFVYETHEGPLEFSGPIRVDGTGQDLAEEAE